MQVLTYHNVGKISYRIIRFEFEAGDIFYIQIKKRIFLNMIPIWLILQEEDWREIEEGAIFEIDQTTNDSKKAFANYQEPFQWIEKAKLYYGLQNSVPNTATISTSI